MLLLLGTLALFTSDMTAEASDRHPVPPRPEKTAKSMAHSVNIFVAPLAIIFLLSSAVFSSFSSFLFRPLWGLQFSATIGFLVIMRYMRCDAMR